MLSYQEDGKLEKLLASLFVDDDELALDDVTVLNWPSIIEILSECCTYSYACYS